MALSTAFKALAADPYGEALQVRLYVRLNDSAGAPGTLLTVTTDQSVLAVNPIARRREMRYGVVQGQSWQVRATNIDLDLLDYELRGCWSAIYGGFPEADEWAVFAQGKNAVSSASTDGTVALEVHDSIMDLLNFTLPRDINFQDTGWIGDMLTVSKASGSGSYSSSQALTLNTATAADDETFAVEFTGAAAFKVILEDGDDSQTGTTGADLDVSNLAADTDIITIPSAGWSGTFTAGDKFEFFTARPRTSGAGGELTPIYMIMHLIDDIAGLSAYDVLDGSAYSSPRDDTSNWTTLANVHDNKDISGFWKKGTKISRLIQDALKIVHGSIYPSATGQIGLWVVGPFGGAAVELNGNPGAGNVDIISMAWDDDLENAISEVTFEYLALDGDEASYTAVDDDSDLLEARGATVDIGWRVDGPTIESTCDNYLTRFKGGVKEYTVNTTLAGVAAEIGYGVAIMENELGISLLVSAATDIIVDLPGNLATIKAHTDPLVLDNYFVLDSSLLDGTDVLM